MTAERSKMAGETGSEISPVESQASFGNGPVAEQSRQIKNPLDTLPRTSKFIAYQPEYDPTRAGEYIKTENNDAIVWIDSVTEKPVAKLPKARGGDGDPSEGLKVPENLNQPENEKRPSFDYVVTRIRELEALDAKERYKPGEDGSYPNLKELDLRYEQFLQYFEIMETPDMAQLQQKLEDTKELEKGLIEGNKTVQEALKLFDESGDQDPQIRNLEKQIAILEKIENPSNGQDVALQVARQQLDRETSLDGEQGAKAKLEYDIENLQRTLQGVSQQVVEQTITGLRSKASRTPYEEAELSRSEEQLTLFRQLEKTRSRLQSFKTYKTPHILVATIKDLRNDPAKQAELREVLIEFLGDERNRLEIEQSLTKVVDYEKIMQSGLKQPGRAEMEKWEREALAQDREDEGQQEKGEIPFTRLPDFQVFAKLQSYVEHGYISKGPEEGQSYNEVVVGLQQNFPEVHQLLTEAVGKGHSEVIAVIERQIERYLFKAFRLGITKGVHNAFDELYSQYKIPEIGYYGEVRRVSESDVAQFIRSFHGVDRLDKYRLSGWPGKFLGIIAYTAQRAGFRMENVISPRQDPEGELDPVEQALLDLAEPELWFLRGEWRSDRADKKAEALIDKRMYWEKSITGYYQFKIDSDVSKNPYAEDQLHMAADQWIAYMQSGVIPKNPQDQLKEWQQFIGQLAPLAERVYKQMYPEDVVTLKKYPENKGRASEEIRRFRQGLKFRAEAPVAAYANAVDEAEAFASVHQTISDDVEGPDVWRQGYEALNGMVAFTLDTIENNPKYSQTLFHPEGSRGHLSANNAAQRLLEKSILGIGRPADNPEQLVKELAQWSLSDKVEATDRATKVLNDEIAKVKAEIEANRGNDPQLAVLRGRLERLEERQNVIGWASRSGELNERLAKRKDEIEKLKQEATEEGIPPDRKRAVNKKLAGLEEEFDKWMKERKKMSAVIRREKLKSIGLDQPRENFLALYDKLEDQDDFKFLSKDEKEKVRVQQALKVESAIQSALDILNITGQLSARSGPVFKIRNPQLLECEYKIEKLNEMIDDHDDYIKKHQVVLVGLDAKGNITKKDDAINFEYRPVLDVPEHLRTEDQKKIASEITRRREQSTLKPQLEAARVERARIAQQLVTSGPLIDRREDRVPVRDVVRFAQLAVYRTEKVWTEEADRIMKSNWSKGEKEKAIQDLCLAIIPDEWNVKKNLPNPADRKLNMTDVLEGVYREALDRVVGDWVIGKDGFFVNRVVGQGFRAQLEVPIAVEQGGKRVIKKELLTNAQGEPLCFEDIVSIPESNGMLMAYYGTEEIMTNTISLPYKVEQAKDGGGGLLGRALRILDPAFNRLSLPEHERDFQKLQRAIHAATEANWQRHFQIKIEVMERSVIGANIRKNKTGKKIDRYKIIDGNPRNNLLEFGRERLYVTGRIINHAAEVLTHADRRSRRAPDLGLYSPMQHESVYDESQAEDSREFFGLIDTMSGVQVKREGARLDFLYLKLKGARWGLGYKQRVALESGPVDGGKQWTGLLEKIYANGDRLNKMWDNWNRSYQRTRLGTGTSPTSYSEIKLIDTTADAELEDYISTAEGSDERLKLSTDTLYPDLSYYRLAQAPLWKDGVDPFLPDGALNFERRELGLDNTLMGLDNGTSRHTTGIWFERVKQWKMDPRKGPRWYPGSAKIAQDLNRKRWLFDTFQTAYDVIKGRVTR